MNIDGFSKVTKVLIGLKTCFTEILYIRYVHCFRCPLGMVAYLIFLAAIVMTCQVCNRWTLCIYLCVLCWYNLRETNLRRMSFCYARIMYFK